MTRRVHAPAPGKRYALRRKLYFGRSLMKPAPVRTSAGGQSGNSGEADKAAAELLQMREMVLRQRAEFDNFRKRTQREKDQIREASAENVLSKMLPVVDNMERALGSAETATDINPVRDGVRMILLQLQRALEAEGLSKVNPLEQPFDPTQHDAIATEERGDVAENHVCEVLLPGYIYNGKVIRAAMVKVAKAPLGEKIPTAE